MSRIFIVFILFTLYGCRVTNGKKTNVLTQNNKQKDNIYYIYDNKKLFETDTYRDDTSRLVFFSYFIPTYTKWFDSIFDTVDWYGFELIHYTIRGSVRYKDTIFKKPKSYLNQIDYYDSTWFENKDNLFRFWEKNEITRVLDDSLKIFLIRDYKNTDSLIIIRVHRRYRDALEGSLLDDLK